MSLVSSARQLTPTGEALMDVGSDPSGELIGVPEPVDHLEGDLDHPPRPLLGLGQVGESGRLGPEVGVVVLSPEVDRERALDIVLIRLRDRSRAGQRIGARDGQDP